LNCKNKKKHKYGLVFSFHCQAAGVIFSKILHFNKNLYIYPHQLQMTIALYIISIISIPMYVIAGMCYSIGRIRFNYHRTISINKIQTINY
jgi:hypothetical protein